MADSAVPTDYSELRKALELNLSPKELKNININKKNPKGAILPYRDAEAVKCILKHINYLRKAFDKQEEEKDSAKGGKDLKDEVATLRQNNNELENKLKKSDTQSRKLWNHMVGNKAKWPGMMDTMQRAEDELNKLRDQLNKEGMRHLGNVNTQNDGDREEIASLKQKLDTLEKENGQLKNKMEDIQDQCEQLRKELDGSSETTEAVVIIQNAKTEIHELKRRLKEFETAKDTRSGSAEKYKEAVSEKEKELSDKRKELEQKDDEIADLKDQVEKLKSEAQLEKPEDGAQDIDKGADTTKLEAEIRDGKKRINDLEQKLEAKENDLKDAKEELRKKSSELESNQEQQLADKDKEIDKLQNQVKEANAELTKMEQELTTKKKELEDCHAKLADKDKENGKLQNQVKDANAKLTKMEQDLTTKKEELQDCHTKLAAIKDQKEDPQSKHQKEDENKARAKQLEKEMTQLKAQKTELEQQINAQKCGEEVKYLRNQVKDLTDRLAEEMNAKVSADESALENINIANRPMKLAEEYQQFCTDTWLNAKQVLDDLEMTEEKSSLLLKEILMISQVICDEAGKGVNAVLMQLLREPVKKEFSKPGKSEKEMTEAIPESARALFNGVGDHLRRTADKVNLDVICQEVTTQTKSKHSKENKQKVFENREMKTYIEDSVRMSWKMVIQRPAMTFSTEGEKQKWNQEKQELAWGSHPDNKGAMVRYYVHPVLKHGDRVMAKGRVMVN